jgi:hypothetical protein
MEAVTVKPVYSMQRHTVPTQACISALETRYPRICARLVQMWFRDEIDTYLDGLILDDRYDRQGFPFEVIDELLFLSDLRWAMSHTERVPEVTLPDADDFVIAALPSLAQAHGAATAARGL